MDGFRWRCRARVWHYPAGDVFYLLCGLTAPGNLDVPPPESPGRPLPGLRILSCAPAAAGFSDPSGRTSREQRK